MLKMVMDIIACVMVCGVLFSWILMFTKAVNDMGDELESIVSKRS